mmetsp:Transcript_38945/g.81852  ORF Transcript_38945/g.81852 Transcript_38945/m.81852 type:complete len:162 (+) Transcript_38945:106-591(+)
MTFPSHDETPPNYNQEFDRLIEALGVLSHQDDLNESSLDSAFTFGIFDSMTLHKKNIKTEQDGDKDIVEHGPMETRLNQDDEEVMDLPLRTFNLSYERNFIRQRGKRRSQIDDKVSQTSSKGPQLKIMRVLTKTYDGPTSKGTFDPASSNLAPKPCHLPNA